LILPFKPIPSAWADVIRWEPPTNIGRTLSPTLKISGPVAEGIMKDVDVVRPNKRKPLTLAEVREAFEPIAEKYPPLLGLHLAAELSGYTPLTLKKKLSEGCFRDCVSRGKPLLFWRDRFVADLMNRPWSGKSRPVAEEAGDEIDGGGDEAH